MGLPKMVDVTVSEMYYGLGVQRNDGWLDFIIWVDPTLRGRCQPDPPTHRLVLWVKLPVYGKMLILTNRTQRMPAQTPITDRIWDKPGKPKFVTQLTFDPDPADGLGQWRQTLNGSWAVRRERIPRKTLWARLR